MKTIKSIGLFFAMGILCIILGFFSGVSFSRNNLMKSDDLRLHYNSVENTQNDEDFESIEKDDQDQRFSSFLDVSATSGLLRANTEYVIWEEDELVGTVVESRETLPDKYVGMDREEFLHAMEQYAAAPPLFEKERGFVGLEVISFSRERVIVQKRYRRARPQDSFYLAVMDYLVVVLMEDRKTVYMTTSISLNMLPQEIQEELMDMIYVEGEKELFDFLEAYSS